MLDIQLKEYQICVSTSRSCPIVLDLEMCVDEHNLLQRRLGCFLHVYRKGCDVQQGRAPVAALVSYSWTIGEGPE